MARPIDQGLRHRTIRTGTRQFPRPHGPGQPPASARSHMLGFRTLGKHHGCGVAPGENRDGADRIFTETTGVSVKLLHVQKARATSQVSSKSRSDSEETCEVALDAVPDARAINRDVKDVDPLEIEVAQLTGRKHVELVASDCTVTKLLQAVQDGGHCRHLRRNGVGGPLRGRRRVVDK